MPVRRLRCAIAGDAVAAISAAVAIDCRGANADRSDDAARAYDTVADANARCRNSADCGCACDYAARPGCAAFGCRKNQGCARR